MRQLAIAVLVTLAGAFVGAAGVTNDAPAVASAGWVVVVVAGSVAIGYAIRALRL